MKDMNTGIEKLDEFVDLLTDTNQILPPRIFFATDTHFFYTTSDKQGIKSTLGLRTHQNIVPSGFKVDRGSMLESFSKFEFLVSQIVLATLNPDISINFFDEKIMKVWNLTLDNITFQNKLIIIENYFCKQLGKLRNLIGIRNQLAHSINLNYIEYNGTNLGDNLETFNNDVLEQWIVLIKLYNEIRDSEKIAVTLTKQMLEMNNGK